MRPHCLNGDDREELSSELAKLEDEWRTGHSSPSPPAFPVWGKILHQESIHVMLIITEKSVNVFFEFQGPGAAGQRTEKGEKGFQSEYQNEISIPQAGPRSALDSDSR